MKSTFVESLPDTWMQLSDSTEASVNGYPNTE